LVSVQGLGFCVITGELKKRSSSSSSSSSDGAGGVGSNVCDIPAAHKPGRMLGRKFLLLISEEHTHNGLESLSGGYTALRVVLWVLNLELQRRRRRRRKANEVLKLFSLRPTVAAE
jgi:hypothetical protein